VGVGLRVCGARGRTTRVEDPVRVAGGMAACGSVDGFAQAPRGPQIAPSPGLVTRARNPSIAV